MIGDSVLTIHFFGRLADTFGPETRLEIPPSSSISDVRRVLISAHPHVSELLASKRIRTCVGETIVADDYVVGENDIIEFLPPVSGG